MKKLLVIAAAFMLIPLSVLGYMQGQGTQEHCDEMRAAIEESDYELWSDIMQERARGRVLDRINEQNFDVFAEYKLAKMRGDEQYAQELKEELGLGQKAHNGMGYGQGKGHQHARAR